jgi:uncharacterized protein
VPHPPQPFFLSVAPGPLGQRFAIYHEPHEDAARGLVVYAHPFAEEMNKSRRMAAMQSRALAQGGFAVLQIDLLGCGDSAGDFGDATWSGWIDDLVHACQWIQHHHRMLASNQPPPSLWLWGLRAGCLLAVDAARRIESACNLVFWQPATSGKALLLQFLRIKLAGELLSGQSKRIMESMRSQLDAGQAIEVAGYTLHPDLCLGMEQATLRAPHHAGRIEWLEVSSSEDATLSPASTANLTQWTQAGWSPRTHLVGGTAFWQTTEIEDAPALLTATLQAMLMPELPSDPSASKALLSA